MIVCDFERSREGHDSVHVPEITVFVARENKLVAQRHEQENKRQRLGVRTNYVTRSKLEVQHMYFNLNLPHEISEALRNE